MKKFIFLIFIILMAVSFDAHATFLRGTNGALDDLTDVVITTVASGNLLKYDGANWVNGPITLNVTASVSGQLPLANGGTQSNLVDPNANTVMGWDDTTNGVIFFALGGGLSYDHASATLSSSKSPLELWWTAGATEPLEASDAIPPISKWTGTNVDILTASFDDTANEGRKVSFKVPSDVKSGSTITFRVLWFSRTATTGNAIWDFKYTSTGANGETWDPALTTLAASAAAVQGTTNLMTSTTVTETLANLGWAANDLITVELVRNGASGSDTLVGDAEVVGIGVEIPRA